MAKPLYWVMEKRIYPQAIDSVVMPEPFGRQIFNDAAKAVAALQALYDRNTKFL
ncbi:MAG: AMP nucleosidase, partial [Mesorhizobium sp.]